MKHRSKAKALYRAGIKVRVCQYPNTDFHGFTLQKNHMFGQDEDGYFVVKRIAENCIYLYRYLDVYSGSVPIGRQWVVQALNRNTDTGRQILAANGGRTGTLEYVSAEKQVRSFYNPRTQAGCNYLPMRNMKIPGGSWGDTMVSVELPEKRIDRWKNGEKVTTPRQSKGEC